ncbi:uncharacterized protein [Dermacentor andersoni]|uniref:uncharacterized protein isoform X3 n=1 Tax=Dermacentor andersoni TaxID=34620 RepID=UPI003B3AAC50
MLDPVQVLWLVAVAALWGFSAPLLRRGGKGVEDIKRQGALNQWLAEVKFLATRPQYVLPFLINQSGSAIYALALGSADLSLAVPLTNSLNFIFVTLAGRILGETTTSTRTYIGMAFVTTGVTLCVADKAWNQAMLTLKVVVVGSCACGKTTLIRTFLRDDVRGSVPAPTVQEVYVGHMQHDGKKTCRRRLLRRSGWSSGTRATLTCCATRTGPLATPKPTWCSSASRCATSSPAARCRLAGRPKCDTSTRTCPCCWSPRKWTFARTP